MKLQSVNRSADGNAEIAGLDIVGRSAED